MGRRTHGMSKTVEYSAWNHILQRCINPNCSNYKYYGARDIKICLRYRNFLNFLHDLGKRPNPKLSIDRIDNDLNYSCGRCEECLTKGWIKNVRWGTKKEQMQNTRQNKWFEYLGERMIIAEWARKLNVAHHAIHRYLKRGHSIEEAVLYYSSPKRQAVKVER